MYIIEWVNNIRYPTHCGAVCFTMQAQEGMHEVEYIAVAVVLLNTTHRALPHTTHTSNNPFRIRTATELYTRLAHETIYEADASRLLRSWCMRLYMRLVHDDDIRGWYMRLHMRLVHETIYEAGAWDYIRGWCMRLYTRLVHETMYEAGAWEYIRG